jgi:hypothetical protein
MLNGFADSPATMAETPIDFSNALPLNEVRTAYGFDFFHLDHLLASTTNGIAP